MSFILRRMVLTLPVVLGVCTLTFFLLHLVPGDPVDIMLGEQATAMDKEGLREELGLNKPLSVQYLHFLKGLARLDLGRSLHNRSPVFEALLERFPATLELTIASMILALLIGLPLGVWSSVRQYSWLDNSLLAGSLMSMSIPAYFLGPLLIWVFALQLDWLPVSERGQVAHLILPSLSLALPLSAVILRITRASMLETIKEDYINVARSKGLSVNQVYFKHALANALIPIITIVGLQVGALLTGTIITETIFDWPGVGTLLYNSIQRRDYPVIQGCILLISLTYVFVNLITDLAYTLVNPKVRMT